MATTTTDRLLNKVSARRDRRQARRKFVGSLAETAARAVVTASVTFAVGLLLKRSFEKGVAQAAEQGAATGAQAPASEAGAATVSSPPVNAEPAAAI